MKRTIAALMFALLTVAIFAQVGGNDWTHVGGPFNKTLPNGTVWSYNVNWSPSTLTRSGDVAAATYDTVDTDGKTKFFVNQINCRTHQYTFAMYDISVAPAKLGLASEWKDISPNTAGSMVETVFCR